MRMPTCCKVWAKLESVAVRMLDSFGVEPQETKVMHGIAVHRVHVDLVVVFEHNGPPERPRPYNVSVCQDIPTLISISAP